MVTSLAEEVMRADRLRVSWYAGLPPTLLGGNPHDVYAALYDDVSNMNGLDQQFVEYEQLTGRCLP